MALQTYSINMGKDSSGGQGCTHKFISLHCFCWILGACIQQKKYYLSVFYYLPFSGSLSVLKGLELSLFYSSVLFLSAFIKSASSLRKKLFFSFCMWSVAVVLSGSWNCCWSSVTVRVLCNREHEVAVWGWSCELCPCGTPVRLYAWCWAKAEDPFHFSPYTEDYIRNKVCGVDKGLLRRCNLGKILRLQVEQSYDCFFLIAGAAEWLRMSISTELASSVLLALLASDFELYAQNICQFSKAPWFKRAFKLVPRSCWNQWNLNTCLTLIILLSIFSELGLLWGYESLGTCMSFAFLHAALHILLMEQSVTH